jgi:DNA transformation protein
MDREALEDLFAPFGRVSIRRMFSGHGVYVEDACFAIVLRGTIWLKADVLTESRFVAANCAPLSYEARGRTITVGGFRSLPEAALDDEDVLRAWCAVALEAARRTAAAKAAAKARKQARAAIARPAKRSRR